MDELSEYIIKEKIELVVWDFDGVVYKLEWRNPKSSIDLVKDLYSKINSIDPSIIIDKDEFLSRLFPYPEIDEVGVRHGKEVQLKLKSLYLEVETANTDRAIQHPEVVAFISKLQKPQVIWSNNYSNTINYLLTKAGIKDRIELIVSSDKVIMSKPNPEGFDLIRARYPEIKNENILLVGDSLFSDKMAAQNANINFFYYKR
jgi:HAD superfamily hydrolase (TIGR01549 family)